MPPKEDWVHPDIEIRDTPGKGRGMFAVRDFAAGEEVLRWGGVFVDATEAAVAKQSGKLVMQFDDNLFSIEERKESDAYFINHSCDPNVWMKNAFTLETRRPVAKGEELTADYVMWEADEEKVSSWDCHCGTPQCRGRVTGEDWKIPELQVRYKGHFLPLIEKRITYENETQKDHA